MFRLRPQRAGYLTHHPELHGLSPVLLGAFILLGALLLSLAGWAGLSALGYEPRALQSTRHSLREAGQRIGAGWTDLADRLRR